MNRDLGSMTWPEAQRLIGAERAVILPLGSTEQHGPHMSQSTDTVLAGMWAARLAERIDGLCLPVQPFGQVWSARDFSGTISLRQSTLEALIGDVADSLYRHGVRRLVVLSGHTGNAASMLGAARAVFDRHPDLTVVRLCYPTPREVAEGVTETPFWNGTTFHAAEIETSLMLAVAPQLCRMELAPVEYPEVRAAHTTSTVPWKAFSATGVFGDARAGSAEKGHALIERWLEVMTRLTHETFAEFTQAGTLARQGFERRET